MPAYPPIAETPWLPSVLFALGCAVLAWVLLRRSSRRFGRPARGGSGPPLDKQHRPVDAWDGVKQDANARFDRQQVELHDLARDLTGQIDSKLILLRELVAQSDRQIRRLEVLLAEADERADAKRDR